MSALPGLSVRLGNLRLSCLYASRRIISSSCVPNMAKVTLEEKLGIVPKPKKPLSPFFQYAISTRPEIAKENPNMHLIEMTKLISEKWKLIDEATKSKLMDKYKLELEKYQSLCKEYDEKLSTSDKEKLLQAKLDIKIAKHKKLLRKKRNDLGCPKKPVPPYFIFSLEKASERGSLPSAEWQKRLGKMWEELPDSAKKKYTDKYKSDWEMYKKKLNQWEQQMIKEGNTDVVRITP
ncbi:transcription factor A, mitochondrial [Cimex lectularius]|uniref:HMG box domain-containing protein n=1 Tax=Cimex lectularius TaxID=79782 RepID=A0A8I6RKQ5_CIMLE|nr:transcription factor A, mitochondrial [Cimex lectularius]